MDERSADDTFLGHPDTITQGFTIALVFPLGMKRKECTFLLVFPLRMKRKGRQTSVCSKGFKEGPWKKLN